MDKRDTEKDLIFDVAMALRGSKLRGVEAEIAARKVVEHLKLCRWRFAREEPGELLGG